MSNAVDGRKWNATKLPTFIEWLCSTKIGSLPWRRPMTIFNLNVLSRMIFAWNISLELSLWLAFCMHIARNVWAEHAPHVSVSVSVSFSIYEMRIPFYLRAKHSTADFFSRFIWLFVKSPPKISNESNKQNIIVRMFSWVVWRDSQCCKTLLLFSNDW